MEQAMHVSYVKLFRDEDGIIRDTQEANGELRNLHHQIALLKDALEREMETVDNLHELLKGVRRIALELNNEILKEDYAKTKE
jgi:flagellar basal body rod protein FlgF